MTTLSKLFLEPQIGAEEPRVVPINGSSRPKESPRTASLRSCQIQALVQQLFFQGKSAPVRHVGFAAVDVTEVQPLPRESPLWDMPNVLICAHSASAMPTENERLTELFCYNLRCYLDSRIGDMRNILDKQLLY